MTINTSITLDFTEKEVIEILKQHITNQGYKYTAHTALITDVTEENSLGLNIPEFEFQGFNFSVTKKDTTKKRNFSNVGGDA